MYKMCKFINNFFLQIKYNKNTKNILQIYEYQITKSQ